MAKANVRVGALSLALAALVLHAPAGAVQAESAEHGRRLAALGLLPIERHAEVLRYSHSGVEPAGGRAAGARHVVVEVVPDREGRSARVVAVSGSGPAAGPPRGVTRAEQTISGEEYRSLRMQLVRIAGDLTLREQDVSATAAACADAPSARLDVKLGGESRMVLSRSGGCDRDATAYRGGEFLLIAAERILGRRIEVARPPR